MDEGDFRKLRQRIAGDPRFRALPGMLLDSGEQGIVRVQRPGEAKGWPVLEDAATQGCLLELLVSTRQVDDVSLERDEDGWTLSCTVNGDPLSIEHEELGNALLLATLASWEPRFFDAVSHGERAPLL